MTHQQVRVFVENLQVLNAKAFDTDKELLQELLLLEIPAARPLGILLVSANNTCLVCGSNLLLHKWCMTAFVGLYMHHTSTNTVLAGHAQYYGYQQEAVDCVWLLTTLTGIHFLILYLIQGNWVFNGHVETTGCRNSYR